MHIDTLALLQSNWAFGNEDVYLCIVATRCASPTQGERNSTRLAFRIDQTALAQAIRYQ